MKKWLFLLMLVLLWHPPLFADTSMSTQGNPRIIIPEPSFQFDPAIEGDVITHEFTIRNTGTAPLEILKIQSG
ncbi:MAG: DUF1573 domain-containing protein [Desulfobacteraceae bacterium]|nr:DUF1573 domain-containing protein [Desulfobacteraceae bacterium]